MYKVNAFTEKGTKFRFRVQGKTIWEVHQAVDEMFKGITMRLILVEPARGK